MGITPGSVHDEGSRVVANGHRERFGTLLNDNVAPSYLARQCGIEGWSVGVVAALQFRDNDLSLEARFTLREKDGLNRTKMFRNLTTNRLSFDGTSVDSKVAKVCQQFLSSVLALNEFE